MGNQHDHDVRDDARTSSLPPTFAGTNEFDMRQLACDLRDLLSRIAACADHALTQLPSDTAGRAVFERIQRIAQQGVRYGERAVVSESGMHRVSPPPSQPPSRPAPRDETVLLVDDDALVSLAMQHQLASGGYRVLVARNARQAELLAAKHEGSVDLLITDLALPGRGGGCDVARAVLALHPRAAVLYMSPYPTTQLVRRGLLGPNAQAIEKPCSRHRLLEMVARSLSETRRSWPPSMPEVAPRSNAAGA